MVSRYGAPIHQVRMAQPYLDLLIRGKNTTILMYSEIFIEIYFAFFFFFFSKRKV